MKPRDLNSWWAGTDKGWIVDTEFGLSAPMLDRIREFLLMVQKQRLTGLIPGSVRDECLETIKALEAGRITQNLVGKGEKVLFDAYKSTKTMVEV